MAIRGSLKEASLPDVLQLLAMGKKTGCLSVTHRQSFGYIYFDKGRICYASIVNRRDRLGDILVKNGLITQAQLDDGDRRAEHAARHAPGRDARRAGRIARDELHALHPAADRGGGLLPVHVDEGTFNFEPDVEPDEQDILVSINPESLLLEGARRVDEWSLIEKKIPSFDLIFELDRARAQRQRRRSSTTRAGPLVRADRRQARRHAARRGVGARRVRGRQGAVRARHRGLPPSRRQVAGRSSPPSRTRASTEHRNLGVAFYKAGMFDEARARVPARASSCARATSGATSTPGSSQLRQGRWRGRGRAVPRGVASQPGAARPCYHNLALRARAARPARRGGRRRSRRRCARGAERSARCARRAACWRCAAATCRRRRAALREAARRCGTASRSRPPWFHYAALAAALAGDIARAVARAVDEGVAAHPHSAVAAQQPRRRRSSGGADSRRRRSRVRARRARGRARCRSCTRTSATGYYRVGPLRRGARGVPPRAVKHRPESRRRRLPQARQHPLSAGRSARRRIRCWERALELEPDERDRAHESRDVAAGANDGDGAVDDARASAALTEKIARERAFGCASYKEKCLRRRIAVRMRARGVHPFADYAALLDRDARGVRAAARRAHDQRHQAVPELGDVRRGGPARSCRCSGRGLRVPSACGVRAARRARSRTRWRCCFTSTPRRAAKRADASRVQVLGTDIDRASLDAARRGQFAEAHSPIRRPTCGADTSRCGRRSRSRRRSGRWCVRAARPDRRSAAGRACT